MDPSIASHRQEILRLSALHGAHHVRIFGSIARENARSDSDLDLLVQLDTGRSLLDLIGIKQDVEDLLGRNVDVVTEQSLSPYLRDQVLKEAIPL